MYRQLLSDSTGLDLREVKLDLSECLLDEGDYPAAEELRKGVIASIDADYNKPGVDLTVQQLAEYGTKLAKCREFQRAASTLLKVLESDRRQLPPEHPDLGQWLESIAHLSLQSLEARVLDGPADDEDRYRTLAAVGESLGEAEAIYRRRLGEGHPWLAKNALLQAKMLGAAGDWPSAGRAANYAVTILTAKFPAEHPWVLEARQDRAIILRELGEFSDAESELREVLTLRQEHFPTLHADVFRTQLDLAKTLYRQGNIAAAKAHLQRMLEKVADRLPNGGRRVARIEALLGACLAAEQDYESAEQRLLSSHAALTSIYGELHAQTREVTEALISLYRTWNKPEKAAEFQRLLDLQSAS